MYSKLYETCLQATKENEIPIACLVRNINTNEEYLFYNQKEKINSILGHAEIEAIKFLTEKYQDFRLEQWEMIVTTDPCIMCMGAIIESRFNKLTILSKKDNYELDQLDRYINSSNTIVQYHIQDEFKNIIKEFFKNKRNMI